MKNWLYTSETYFVNKISVRSIFMQFFQCVLWRLIVFASCEELFYIFRSLWLMSYESLCMLWNICLLWNILFSCCPTWEGVWNIAVWNIVDLLLEKSLVLEGPSTVWFLNRKSHCERSHSCSGEHWCEQWRSLSLPVFWLIFSIRPSRVGAEGDCQETYPIKGPLGRWIQLKEACFWWPPRQEDYVQVIYYDVFLATMQAYQCSMRPGPGQLES